MKRVIKVFPDYLSSGLWGNNGGSICESEVSHCVSPIAMIALKYWHMTWDVYNESWNKGDICTNKWEADGLLIVDTMNASQDEFHFVYVGDNF